MYDSNDHCIVYMVIVTVGYMMYVNYGENCSRLFGLSHGPWWWGHEVELSLSIYYSSVITVGSQYGYDKPFRKLNRT